MLDLPILIKKIRIDFISKFVLKLEISSSMPKNYCKLGKKLQLIKIIQSVFFLSRGTKKMKVAR